MRSRRKFPLDQLRTWVPSLRDQGRGFESIRSATAASPLWASRRSYLCLYPYAEPEFAGQDGGTVSSQSYPQGWSHVTHWLKGPLAGHNCLEHYCSVVSGGMRWGSPCKSRLPLEKMSRQVVQLQQLVCCSDWIRRRLPCWRMFHRQRSQTSSGATVFATIRSTPFCPPFVAEARPSALIETVLLPLRSIFTSPHSERLARQHGNG
jgi:hypothetical protein